MPFSWLHSNCVLRYLNITLKHLAWLFYFMLHISSLLYDFLFCIVTLFSQQQTICIHWIFKCFAANHTQITYKQNNLELALCITPITRYRQIIPGQILVTSSLSLQGMCHVVKLSGIMSWKYITFSYLKLFYHVWLYVMLSIFHSVGDGFGSQIGRSRKRI
mgnify:FL=1